MIKNHTLLIKNMVCQRCITTVDEILTRLNIPFTNISLGEVDVPQLLPEDLSKVLDNELRKVGFELIENRINKIIATIKRAVVDYLETFSAGSIKINLSVFITERIHYEYSYLSDIFSSVEGKSIEQYFIILRIEKVKELIVYDQLSLTEIAYQCGFSSVHHLSAQFRKVTGLTPSRFRIIGSQKRKSIDNL